MEETKTVKIKFIDKRHDVGNFPIELIEHALQMYFGQCDEIIVSELPSPDILIPSEEEIVSFVKRCDPLNQTLEKQADLRMGANWALSRLKELNKHVNFKTK